MRTRLWWRNLGFVGICFVVAPWVGAAQSSSSTGDALTAMTDRAGVVFVGTVSNIRRVVSDGGSSGAVEITFAVDQAVKGCASGSTYRLREWAGLWVANDARYRVGQRLFMLLHTPGPGGLSGPVDGLNGAIPVYGTAPAVGPDSTTSASAAGAAVADLRWIAAGEVVRSVSWAAPSQVSTPVGHGSPLQVTARMQSNTAADPALNARVAASGTSQIEPATEHPETPGSLALHAETVAVSKLVAQLQQREVSRGR